MARDWSSGTTVIGFRNKNGQMVWEGTEKPGME